jgi:hypothetical protein
MVRAEERSLKPELPVSTNTPSIVWQVEVPGTQTVTLVNAASTESPVGPPFTAIVATFGPEVVIVWAGAGLELLLLLLLPPPPQAAENASAKQTARAWNPVAFIGFPPPSRSKVAGLGYRLFQQMIADVHPPAPQVQAARS